MAHERLFELLFCVCAVKGSDDVCCVFCVIVEECELQRVSTWVLPSSKLLCTCLTPLSGRLVKPSSPKRSVAVLCVPLYLAFLCVILCRLLARCVRGLWPLYVHDLAG